MLFSPASYYINPIRYKLGPNILHSILLLDTFNMCSSLQVTDLHTRMKQHVKV
jgi:hypothetical protein